MVAGFTKNKDVRRAQRIKSLNTRLNGASRFNEGGYCMKTDSQLKGDISEELAWDPAINAAGIGVMVAVGVVTLTGHLDSFAEKHAVEHAIHRVSGMRAVALELDVKLAPEHKRSESEIAQAAATALQFNSIQFIITRRKNTSRGRKRLSDFNGRRKLGLPIYPCRTKHTAAGRCTRFKQLHSSQAKCRWQRHRLRHQS